MSPSGRIELAHGAGGAASRRLLEQVVLPRLTDPRLAALTDGAVVAGTGRRAIVVTTDAFVVSPRRFPGGSLGSLSVHGSLNDLAVSAARPLALTAAWVLEEGLGLQEWEAELDAMADAADQAGVAVVAGDTKVVPRGQADGCYVVTTGVGESVLEHPPQAAAVRTGDAVVLSGTIGDHGTAVLLARGDLHIDADVRSDSRSVWPLVAAMLDRCGDAVAWMRDPTRGGLATALNELATAAGVVVDLDEPAVPVRPPVRGALELLGLDPLYVANEGCFVAVVRAEVALAAAGHAAVPARWGARRGHRTDRTRGATVAPGSGGGAPRWVAAGWSTC